MDNNIFVSFSVTDDRDRTDFLEVFNLLKSICPTAYEAHSSLIYLSTDISEVEIADLLYRHKRPHFMDLYVMNMTTGQVSVRGEEDDIGEPLQYISRHW